MKGRPAGLGRLHLEAKLSEIEGIDKRIDGSDGIVFADPIVEALRQQSPLPPVFPFNEAFHKPPLQIARRSYLTRRFHAARTLCGRIFFMPASGTPRPTQEAELRH
jgi:hypothetical protein